MLSRILGEAVSVAASPSRTPGRVSGAKEAVAGLFSLYRDGVFRMGNVEVRHDALKQRPRVLKRGSTVGLEWLSGLKVEAGSDSTAAYLPLTGGDLQVRVPFGLGELLDDVQKAVSGEPIEAQGALITLPAVSPLPVISLKGNVLRAEFVPWAKAKKGRFNATLTGMNIYTDRIVVDVRWEIMGKDFAKDPVILL